MALLTKGKAAKAPKKAVFKMDGNLSKDHAKKKDGGMKEPYRSEKPARTKPKGKK